MLGRGLKTLGINCSLKNDYVVGDGVVSGWHGGEGEGVGVEAEDEE